MGKKIVSKEELDTFIKNYPRKLNKNVNGIFEPPYLFYHDFTIAKDSYESVVCGTLLNTAMKEHPSYDNEPDEHFIME